MKWRVLGTIILSFGGSIWGAPTHWTESPRQVGEITKALPAPAQQVIARLIELDALPQGTWRYHAADLAHGESPELDDSNWPTAGQDVSYPEGTWFRQWIVVPKTLHGYDLDGARIWYDNVTRRRTSQIIYFNGRRVAMGESLEPMVLFDHAKPGDKILIAIKVLDTVPNRFTDDISLRVESAPNRPSPHDLQEELLSATALVPSLSKSIDANMATLIRAIEKVDVSALDSGNQQEFDDSLNASKSILETLKPLLQEATFHETGDAHIDAAWLWTWTESVDVVRRTFGTALQLMNEYPTYTFTQSAAQYNEWMAEKYPKINDGIKERIKEGRWEIVGGMWVEPDLNMPDGESTARSILIGKRWYEQHYGVDVRIGWNPDSFGYNWQLPQIYKKSGIDYFVTQKMRWNDTNQLPLKLFWWESPDGSKVLTYFPHEYGNRNLSPVRLSVDMKEARTYSPGMTEMMDLYGVSDHGGGPTRAMLDQGLHWMEPDKIVPKMKFGTAAAFFSTVEKEIAPDSPQWDYRTIAKGYHEPQTPNQGEIAIPTWNDELYLETHRGVFTSQAKMKRNVRESSEWALNAEKYASLAWLDGNAYPGNELTDSWEKITFNDFHDLAPGSGVAQIYRDAQRDYDQVRRDTNEISAKALNTIASQIDTAAAGAVPILVFNPLGWNRSGIVTIDVQMPSATEHVSVLDPRGRVLPSEVLSSIPKTNTFKLLVDAKDVPSLGYEVLHVVPGSRSFSSDLHVTGTTLENAYLRVAIDPKTGCITSLYDKKSNFETLAASTCGNELQAFKDEPKTNDAWNIDPGTLDQPPTNLTLADSVKVIENGSMRAVVRITRTWQQSKFVQDIVLYTGADEVDVVNDIDWHETHMLLKAAFALSASSPFATYEIPYGTIQRPTTRNNSWEKARFEVPALRWADLGDAQHSFSLINESKYGYDGVGNMLRLTLLRAPVLPDPNADRGHHHFKYALYPHAGDWKQALTVRHGYEFNYHMKAMQVEAHSGTMPIDHSFVSVLPDDVVLTAMKKAEDSNSLILHMYEWAGREGNVKITVPPGATSAIETNLMEQEQGSPLAVRNNEVTLPIHPYEILAVRVDYPHQ